MGENYHHENLPIIIQISVNYKDMSAETNFRKDYFTINYSCKFVRLFNLKAICYTNTHDPISR